MNFENTLFNKFDTIEIDNIKYRDLFNNYDIINEVDKGEFFSTYSIQGSPNLDLLSYEIYGDASYYWIIIMINNIQDVFYDLPLSSEELKKIAKQKILEEGLDFSSNFYDYYTKLEDENNNKRIIKIVRPEKLNRFITLLEKA